MLIEYIAIIPVTILGAVGSFYFKKAAAKSISIINILSKPELFLGGVFYIVSIIIYISMLKNLPLTKLLPLTSLTYVWSLGIAIFVLKEIITRLKVFGAILIIIGASIISIS